MPDIDIITDPPNSIATFTFTSNSENLTESGTSALITFSYDGTDGNPAGSCLWTIPNPTTISSTTDTTEVAIQTPLSQTWETLGVTAGHAVTGICLKSIDILAPTISHTESPVPPYTYITRIMEFTLVDTSGNVICTAASVSGEVPTGVETSFGTFTYNASGAVPEAYQASNTEVRLKCTLRFLAGYTYITGTLGIPVHLMAFDNIAFAALTDGGGGGGSPSPDPSPAPVDIVIKASDPPVAENNVLGTYNLDLFFNHRYRGIRESEKFTRVSKSSIIDSHLMMNTSDSTKVYIEPSVSSIDTKVTSINKSLQHMKMQIAWRVTK